MYRAIQLPDPWVIEQEKKRRKRNGGGVRNSVRNCRSPNRRPTGSRIRRRTGQGRARQAGVTVIHFDQTPGERHNSDPLRTGTPALAGVPIRFLDHFGSS